MWAWVLAIGVVVGVVGTMALARNLNRGDRVESVMASARSEGQAVTRS